MSSFSGSCWSGYYAAMDEWIDDWSEVEKSNGGVRDVQK